MNDARYRLLIVDDERPLCEGLMAFDWESLGFEAIGSAMNGEAALAILAASGADVLLTDIKMPFINGIELCRIVKKTYPAMKMILLTGYKEFEYARAAISLGVTEYLLKPIDLKELRDLFLVLKAQLDEEGRSIGGQATDAVPGEPLCEVVQRIARLVEDFRRAPKSLTWAYADKALLFIEENLASKISMSQAAERVGLNESYFSQIFKKETGVNFVDYLRDRRIAKAIELMKDPSLRIYQIGQAVGYDDAAYFAGTFRRCTGYTPLDYKRRLTTEGSSRP
jgi:two-component system, response regulator YesN